MENSEEKYSAGGSFETTIGRTQYEVVMNFKEEDIERVIKEEARRAVHEKYMTIYTCCKEVYNAVRPLV